MKRISTFTVKSQSLQTIRNIETVGTTARPPSRASSLQRAGAQHRGRVVAAWTRMSVDNGGDGGADDGDGGRQPSLRPAAHSLSPSHDEKPAKGLLSFLPPPPVRERWARFTYLSLRQVRHVRSRALRCSWSPFRRVARVCSTPRSRAFLAFSYMADVSDRHLLFVAHVLWSPLIKL